MKKSLLQLYDNGTTYEVTISTPAILQITKIMEDSGIIREVKFDELSRTMQEKILERISESE